MRIDTDQLLEKARQRVEEIAGTCELHGVYTYAEQDSCGFFGVGCPKCEAERQIQERAQARKSEFARQSRVPARFLDCALDDYAPPNAKATAHLAVLRNYAEHFAEHHKAGRSLTLLGSTGTGKTMLACAVLRHLALGQGRIGRYATAYHIVRDIKATYSDKGRSEEQVVASYVQPPLLVIDEIGVQFGTDAEKLLLFEIINGRYEAMLPTIVVSNLKRDELGPYLGDRILDRLMENGGAVLSFDWGSWRK